MSTKNKELVEKPATTDTTFNADEVPAIVDIVTDVFDVDYDRVVEGVWFAIEGTGDPENDIAPDRLKIRHVENLKFLKLVEKEVNKLRQASQLKDKEVSAIDRSHITMRMVARHRLVDWDIVRNGVKFPYSEDEALKLLILSPKFERYVRDKSMDLSNFNRIEKETKIKK